MSHFFTFHFLSSTRFRRKKITINSIISYQIHYLLRIIQYLNFFLYVRMSFLLITEQPPAPTNPCQPSPCGPNAECQVRGDSPACSCIANYIGVPPNCRPECTINPECPPHLACMQKKCRDPCIGLCGSNAQCSVVNHHAVCACAEGYTGNPFSTCEPVVKGEYTFKEKEFFVSFLSFFFFSLQISPVACLAKNR